MQWEKPKADDPPPPYNVETMAMRMEWWNMGYTDQTRLWIDDAYMITLLQLQAYLATGKYVYLDRAARETALFLAVNFLTTLSPTLWPGLGTRGYL